MSTQNLTPTMYADVTDDELATILVAIDDELKDDVPEDRREDCMGFMAQARTEAERRHLPLANLGL